MIENKQKMLEVLEETASYYNLTNRSMVNSSCAYVGDQNCCAVGRLLPEELLEMIVRRDYNTDSDVETICSKIEGIGSFFQEQELPVEFLLKLQDLHDIDRHWTLNGLSDKGYDYVASIKQQFGL